MSAIALLGVTKVYDQGHRAVDAVDLSVAEGEFVVLLGPTGCGKTTILRIVAGLDAPTSGSVLIDGEAVDTLPARDRRVAMVFQDFALYPHLTVAENIAFPLRTEPSADDASVGARVREVAALVGVADVLHRRPKQLSGGQRQRVAMARAIARRPRVFLLDEPLSNVDAAVRAELRTEIVRLTRVLGVAAIYVTHDQTEAMTMADRIAVMRRGRIEQIGPPHEIYSDPHRLFVAAFVGTPRTSLLQAAVYRRAGVEAILDLGEQAITLPWSDPRAQVLAEHHTARVTVGLRPDALRIVDDRTSGMTLRGTVVQIEHLGNEIILMIDIGGVPTAVELSQLELPDTPGALAEAVAEPPTEHHGVDALRGTFSRWVSHAHAPAPPPTARTAYGFYPVYDPDDDQQHPPPLGGTVAVRLGMPAPVPRPGETVTMAVDFDRVFLFDGNGDRIRVDGAEPPGILPPNPAQ
jgi:multiple sugar transport system ATP-binding protein